MNVLLRRWWPLALVAAALLLIGWLSESSGRGGALDPDGTSPQGAKALVLLLRQYGATVNSDTGLPDPGATALVLVDEMTTTRRRQVAAWVKAGGRLIVADPSSQLEPAAPAPVTSTGDDLRPAGPCHLLGLDAIRRLDVGPSDFLRGTTGCFPEGSTEGPSDFLVDVPLGRGDIVGLGGAGLWTNARLDHEDNAALAVDLMPGTVDVLVAPPAGSGTQSALDLLNPRLKLAVLQLFVAFGALAWWKGRRLGRPVDESQPVALDGSEIVVAVGDLLARTSSHDAAAAQLRAGTRRWVGERLGTGPRAPADQLADVAWARLGVDRAHTYSLLADAPVPDDEALVRLAQSLVSLRQEVAHGR